MCLLLILIYVLQRSKKDSRTFHHLIIIFGAVLLPFGVKRAKPWYGLLF
jgi:hypothetical protein